jgi:hypothetical protein
MDYIIGNIFKELYKIKERIKEEKEKIILKIKYKNYLYILKYI